MGFKLPGLPGLPSLPGMKSKSKPPQGRMRSVRAPGAGMGQGQGQGLATAPGQNRGLPMAQPMARPMSQPMPQQMPQPRPLMGPGPGLKNDIMGRGVVNRPGWGGPQAPPMAPPPMQPPMPFSGSMQDGFNPGNRDFGQQGGNGIGGAMRSIQAPQQMMPQQMPPAPVDPAFGGGDDFDPRRMNPFM